MKSSIILGHGSKDMRRKITEEEIIKIWNMVFNISLNMLHNEFDAEDAAQQIFEKAIRNIDKFKGHSKFETWVYRIAYNYLLDIKKARFQDEISFELFEKDISYFTPYKNQMNLTKEEEKLYVEQIKAGCTLAMLQCLDKESRFIYIIGNIFNIPGNEASLICNIKETAYRKKLSRAREKIRNFMEKNCGLLNPNAQCRCRKRLLIAREQGRIDFNKILYQTDNKTICECINEMNEIDSSSKIFQENLFHNKRDLFISRMKSQFKILRENYVSLFEQ